MKKLIIHTDGGSRGNPGKAAVGVVVSDGDQKIFESFKTIGVATNNEAEYGAVLVALDWLLSSSGSSDEAAEVEFLLDSKLVVEQLNKKWKIKEPRLADLAQKCWQKISSLPHRVSFKHIPREQNAEADALVNKALDAEL